MAALLIAVPWLARHRRAWLAAAIAAVAFMGLSRIFVGAHYTSDVLGGVLLGCVVVGAWAFWRASRGGDALEAPPGSVRRRGAG
jgi:undecaprenyl-diphosphatase